LPAPDPAAPTPPLAPSSSWLLNRADTADGTVAAAGLAAGHRRETTLPLPPLHIPGPRRATRPGLSHVRPR
jgi:hypothetical protein